MTRDELAREYSGRDKTPQSHFVNPGGNLHIEMVRLFEVKETAFLAGYDAALKVESVGDEEAALSFLKDHYGINQNQELEDPDGVSFFLAGCRHKAAQSQAEIAEIRKHWDDDIHCLNRVTEERDRYKKALEKISDTQSKTLQEKY